MRRNRVNKILILVSILAVSITLTGCSMEFKFDKNKNDYRLTPNGDDVIQESISE